MIHQLKLEKDCFIAVLKGDKTFEIRNDDRHFRVGDIVGFNEVELVDSSHSRYSGRSILARITYILNDDRYVPDGYVAFSFETLGVFRHSRRILDDNCVEPWDFRLVTDFYEIQAGGVFDESI